MRCLIISVLLCFVACDLPWDKEDNREHLDAWVTAVYPWDGIVAYRVNFSAVATTYSGKATAIFYKEGKEISGSYLTFIPGQHQNQYLICFAGEFDSCKIHVEVVYDGRIYLAETTWSFFSII